MNKMDSLITLIHENFPDAHTESFCGELFVSHIANDSSQVLINFDFNSYLLYNKATRSSYVYHDVELVIDALRRFLFSPARSA